MIQLEGARSFPQTREELWSRLSDAQFLLDNIPDIHEVKESAPAKAVCTIRPGFAFIRGTLTVNLEIVEAISPSLVRLVLLSKGIGSSSEAEGTLNLSEIDSGSEVQWKVEVTKLGGLLRAVPKGLIRGAADKVIGDAWSSIESHLNKPPAQNEGGE